MVNVDTGLNRWAKNLGFLESGMGGLGMVKRARLVGCGAKRVWNVGVM